MPLRRNTGADAPSVLPPGRQHPPGSLHDRRQVLIRERVRRASLLGAVAFRSSLPPSAIPSTLIVDREGRVAARIVGATTTPELRQVIEEVLAESP